MPVPITAVVGYSDPVKIFNRYNSTFKLLTCEYCNRKLYECYACKSWIWGILPHKCEFTLLEEELKKTHKGEVNARYSIDETACKHLFKAIDQNGWWIYYENNGDIFARLRFGVSFA